MDNPVEQRRNPWPIIVLVAGLLLIGWYGLNALRTPSRCHDIYLQDASAQLSTSHAPVRPSDAAWYNEHCFEGKPR